MALPIQVQLKYWGIAAVVFFALLWTLGDVILPFILGGAIAYCLDPIADALERMKLPRAAAVAVITLGAVIVFVLATLLVVPLLVEQSIALFNMAPELFQNLRTFLTEQFPSLMEPESTLRKSLDGLGETIRERGGELVNTILGSVSGLVNIIVLVVIVPVVAFYLLLDWDRMVARIDELLPRDHAPVIRQLAREVDKTLAAFIRGQGTVCLILGAYYAIALMLVGLQFGLIVGFVAGLISFIPYVGALFGGVLALGLAVFQFWGEWWWIVAVFAIFQIGQIVEGNILTPNLVGSSVGLHPVWLIFALSAFGALFGFVGLLVAVPVAASLGVIVRYLIARYQEGRLYRGVEAERPAPDAAPED